MQTLLNKFCEDFDLILRPILGPVGEAAAAIAATTEPIPARALESDVIELRMQIEALAAKVAEQQAYVLIFGPLKSGKSTLMNALCASYVSEVSSLPAYPCMVFVSHAPAREFTVTLYNAEQQVFRDEIALHSFMHRAHAELAEQIRRVELAGGAFDPKEHFPGAIRRIDVKLPAGDLEQSGAVLVDTPGLYSRMKFGYDRMTREFRNAAACAVFVVKSDNLFLEQVFSEFERLLELFSKIFLVVNLDVTKHDLGMKGDLVPSLESQDPMRIIDAFERLVMSAPLKAAADAGRLKIFPVGLLSAAQARLKAAHDPEHAENQAGDLAGFTPFIDDLTDYLDSPDYLVAFLGDSIHRASTLLQETRDLGSHSEVRSLAIEVDDFERQRDVETARAEAADRLRAYPWSEQLKRMRAEMQREVIGRTRAIDDKARAALEGSVGRWFETAASLDGLVQDELQPLFLGFQEDAVLATHKILSERIRKGFGGIRLPSDLVDDLRRVDLDVESIAHRIVNSIDSESLVVMPPRSVDADAVPVRRRIWDWLRFRSRPKVRALVFGPSKRPNIRIPPELKASRLGADGRRAIVESAERFQDEFGDVTIRRLTDHFFGSYNTKLAEELDVTISELSRVARDRETDLARQVETRRRVLEPLEAMRDSAQVALRQVDDLANRYRGTDPADLLRTVELKPQINGEATDAPASEPTVELPRPEPDSAPAPARDPDEEPIEPASS